MKKKLVIMSVIVLFATIFTACTSGNNGMETTSPQVEKTSPQVTETVKSDTFTVSIPAEIMTLNPMKFADTWSGMAACNTHDTLVRADEFGEIQPALAESWEISEDGLEYTFQLRKGVTFHDGTPFTAKDVKYSIERAMTEPSARRFTVSFKNVDIVNDYECILNLENSMAATLNYLAVPCNSIISEEIINRIGEDEYATKNPCGTGPFIFKEWIPGDRIIFTANENYYLGAPSIKTLIIRNISDKSASLVALETGDIDAVVEASSSDKQTVLENPNLSWYETTSVVYYSLQVNNKIEPFNDVRVRKALDMAINRDEIIAIALEGQGLPATSGVSIYSFGYVDEIKNAPHNPEQAKALLTDAGYPDGFDTNIYVRDDFMQKAAQVIQSQWAKIGVNAQVHVMERGALMTDMMDGNLEIPMSMATDLPLDASLHLNTLDSRYFGHNGANFTFWSDTEFDSLNIQQLKETNPSKRAEIIKKCLLIEKENVPAIPLFYHNVNIAMRADIKGLEQPYPTNVYFWYKLYR